MIKFGSDENLLNSLHGGIENHIKMHETFNRLLKLEIKSLGSPVLGTKIPTPIRPWDQLAYMLKCTIVTNNGKIYMINNLTNIGEYSKIRKKFKVSNKLDGKSYMAYKFLFENWITYNSTLNAVNVMKRELGRFNDDVGDSPVANPTILKY